MIHFDNSITHTNQWCYHSIDLSTKIECTYAAQGTPDIYMETKVLSIIFLGAKTLLRWQNARWTER